MRDFNELSGAWAGWSIQYGLRITESIQLTINKGRIFGSGTDKDGEFELVGAYIDRKQEVLITRTYTLTTEPTQSGVGIPYEYVGKWDGLFVSGLWFPRRYPDMDGGPFEMWPGGEDMKLEIQAEVEEEAPLAVGGRR
ncbi:MAG: hypothetical protein H7Y17_11775 [Chlorobia bacterium]|nr:hypothetical protein [Fimbriimonadaceae bacterium]